MTQKPPSAPIPRETAPDAANQALGATATVLAANPTVKKNRHAAALGRLGGAARAKNLSAEKLSEIGRAGASKRWGNRKLLKLS